MEQKINVSIGSLCFLLLLIMACNNDKKKTQESKQEQNQQAIVFETLDDNSRDTTVDTTHIEIDASTSYSINKSKSEIDTFKYKNYSFQEIKIIRDNLFKTDTVKKYKGKNVFRSSILDSIFTVKSGCYVNSFGTDSDNREIEFDVMSFENIRTGRNLSLLLIYENGMYTIRDTFSYLKQNFIGFTLSHNTSLPYVDYLTVGNYISSEGEVYDPERGVVFDVESDVDSGIWKYCANKIYGVTNTGQLILLKDKLWDACTLKELYHQTANDTIEFINPMP